MRHIDVLVIALHKNILMTDLIHPCLPNILKNTPYVDNGDFRYWGLHDYNWPDNFINDYNNYKIFTVLNSKYSNQVALIHNYAYQHRMYKIGIVDKLLNISGLMSRGVFVEPYITIKT